MAISRPLRCERSQLMQGLHHRPQYNDDLQCNGGVARAPSDNVHGRRLHAPHSVEVFRLHLPRNQRRWQQATDEAVSK